MRIEITSLARALCAAVALLTALPASAQGYPDKPIRMVVPFPAAGPTDAYARLVGRMLQEELGQPVVVENRAGGTGLIGTSVVKDAPADGYTLLYTSNSAQVIGPLLHKPHSFDSVADFTPITQPLRYPMYLIASARLPINSFEEFIALARSQPGKLTYASVGTGSGGHLACELLNDSAGIRTLHVPYKGAAPAQLAVITGETDFMCDSVGFSQPQVAAGKMKGLALTADKRSAVVPTVPTMSEKGVNVKAYIWQGMFAPRNLPADVRDRLYAAMTKIMRSPEMTARMQKDGYDLVAQPPEQFSRDIQAEKAVWQDLIATKNIKLE